MYVLVYKRDRVRNNADLIAYQELMNHSLLRSKNTTLPYHALHQLYSIYYVYYFARYDFVNAYSYAQKVVKLIEAHPHQISEDPPAYINALHNLLVVLGRLKKYNELILIIQKMRAVNIKYERFRDSIFYSTNIHQLTMYSDTGQYDKGLKLITEISGELNVAFLHKAREMEIHYVISLIYFGVGRYRDARNYLNKIINDSINDLRSDINCFARIINLIVHYELGNLDLLEYIVKSTYRFLYKRNRLYKVETTIVDFIRRKIPSIFTDQERIEAFQELKTELEEITKDPFEKIAIEYFDFISWIKSKIENRPFAQIVQEKAGQKL